MVASVFASNRIAATVLPSRVELELAGSLRLSMVMMVIEKATMKH